VLWRRGSMPAVNRTVEQERPAIQQILQRKKVEERRTQLIAELKKKFVQNVDESLLTHIDTSAFGDTASRAAPAFSARRPARVDPAPTAGERGQR
jgi:hypothetical protein